MYPKYLLKTLCLSIETLSNDNPFGGDMIRLDNAKSEISVKSQSNKFIILIGVAVVAIAMLIIISAMWILKTKYEPISLTPPGIDNAKPNMFESINLDKNILQLEVGASDTLSIRSIPENTDNQIIWETSNPSVATIFDGTVQAVSPGVVSIYATSADGFTQATCQVIVSKTIIPEGISLNKTNLNMLVNETDNLTVSFQPSEAQTKNIYWSSSDPSVATVNLTGLVTAKKLGRATITAKTLEDTLVATATVNVLANVDGITLSHQNVNITVGGTQELSASIKPANVLDKSVTWVSANTSIATVDNKGNITAESAGTTTITATSADGKYSATCNVKVAPKLISITLDRSELELKAVDSRQKLIVTTDPPTAITDLVWTVEDKDIVRVNQDGTVIALDSGSTVVKVSAKSNKRIFDECVVTVNTQVKELSLAPTMTMSVGETQQLDVKTVPAINSSRITWATSNSNLATVDDHGNVRALGTGNVTITAKLDDTTKTAKCSITIVRPAKSIMLDKEEYVVELNKTTEAKAMLYPSDATTPLLVWETTDKNIAVVSGGAILGLSAGECEIKVSTNDGSGLIKIAKVRVIHPHTKFFIPNLASNSISGISSNLDWGVANLPTTLEIPNTFQGVVIQAIDDSAFYNSPLAVSKLSNVTKLILPDTIIKLGGNALRNSMSLRELKNIEKIVEFGLSSLEGTSNLTGNLTLDQTTIIGDRAFLGSGFTSISITSPLTTLGTEAFSGAKLTSLDMSLSPLTNLPNRLLSNSQHIAVAKFKGVQTIGNMTFNNCLALRDLYLADSSITSVDSNAFAGTKDLIIHLSPGDTQSETILLAAGITSEQIRYDAK